jgi:hypothetical protein
MSYIDTHVCSISLTFYSQQPPSSARVPASHLGFAFNNFLYSSIQNGSHQGCCKSDSLSHIRSEQGVQIRWTHQVFGIEQGERLPHVEVIASSSELSLDHGFYIQHLTLSERISYRQPGVGAPKPPLVHSRSVQHKATSLTNLLFMWSHMSHSLVAIRQPGLNQLICAIHTMAQTISTSSR